MTDEIYLTILSQAAIGWEYFSCSRCANYEGNLKCSKGVFISVEGANMSDCVYYGKRCYASVERIRREG